VSLQEYKKALQNANSNAATTAAHAIRANIFKLVSDEWMEVDYITANCAIACPGLLPTPFHLFHALFLDKGKPDPAKDGNWRLLSMASTERNLVATIFNKRRLAITDKNLTRHPRQTVAIKRMNGTITNYSLVASAIRHAHQYNQPIVVASLDISEAFPTLSLGLYEKGLIYEGVPQHYILTLLALVKDMMVEIWDGQEKYGPYHSQRGAPQGGIESPDALISAYNPLIWHMQEVCHGYRIPSSRQGHPPLNLVLAASMDDFILVAPSEAAMRDTISRLVLFMKQNQIDVNLDKSITMANFPQSPQQNIANSVCYDSLKRASSVKYVGFVLAMDLSNKQTLDIMTEKKATAINHINETSLPWNHKVNLADMTIISMLTYYQQVVAWNTNQTQVLSTQIESWMKEQLRVIVAFPTQVIPTQHSSGRLPIANAAHIGRACAYFALVNSHDPFVREWMQVMARCQAACSKHPISEMFNPEQNLVTITNKHNVQLSNDKFGVLAIWVGQEGTRSHKTLRKYLTQCETVQLEEEARHNAYQIGCPLIAARVHKTLAHQALKAADPLTQAIVTKAKYGFAPTRTYRAIRHNESPQCVTPFCKAQGTLDHILLQCAEAEMAHQVYSKRRQNAISRVARVITAAGEAQVVTITVHRGEPIHLHIITGTTESFFHLTITSPTEYRIPECPERYRLLGALVTHPRKAITGTLDWTALGEPSESCYENLLNAGLTAPTAARITTKVGTRLAQEAAHFLLHPDAPNYVVFKHNKA
jgi:hypothetical protein